MFLHLYQYEVYFSVVRISAAKKHLVIGGTGQLGICLLRYLLSIGYGVRTIVRNPDALYSGGVQDDVEILTGDMDDLFSFRPIIEGSAVVYYCATKWITQPHEAIQEMRWAESLAIACAEYNARLVVPICAWAYGPPRQNPVPETHVLAAGSPYGTAKASVEHVVQKLHKTIGLKATVLRIPAMWGPFTRCPMLLKPIVAISRGFPFYIPCNGEARVEFVDPRDVARTMVACAENDDTIGAVYNIPGSGDIKWFEFATWVTKVASTGSRVIAGPKTFISRFFGYGALESSLSWWYENTFILDGTAIRADLNYHNIYSLKQSIVDNWKWYANRRPDDPLGYK